MFYKVAISFSNSKKRSEMLICGMCKFVEFIAYWYLISLLIIEVFLLNLTIDSIAVKV